jgi:hypothetical protein
LGRRAHALALLLYLLLTLGMTWPLVLQAGSAIPGDGFDGWQNYWNLWWMRSALLERLQWPYSTDLLYFPTGVSLLFHTLNPFNGLVSLPVQLAAGAIAAYNFVVLLSFTLSGYGAFLLAAWILRPRQGMGGVSARARFWAALIAGAIFAFSPFHWAHLLGHMQVFAYQWVPFAALYALRAMDSARAGRQAWRDVAMGGLFLALAALCDWYFALYLAIFVAMASIWISGSTLRTDAGVRSAGRVFAAALGIAAVGAHLLSPILLPMVMQAARSDSMVRPVQDLYIYSATFADFVIPSRLHTLARPESFAWIGNQIAPVSERTVAVGYLALALSVAALFVDRRRALPWLIGAVLFTLLAMGPRLHLATIGWEDVPSGATGTEWTPYALLNRLIPFMRISRSVSRFALMVQMCIAVAAAIGLAGLLERFAVKRLALWGAAALAVVVAQTWVAPFPLSQPDTPQVYSTLQNPSDPSLPAILNLPMNYDRPGYLLYQTVHRRPLTVAYVSREDPATLTERVPLLQQLRHLGPDILQGEPAQVGMTILSDLGVGTVVLDRYKMPGGLEKAYTEEVAAEMFADQQPLFEDDRVTVYEVQRPEVPATYLEMGVEGWGELEPGVDGSPVGRRIGEIPATITIRHGDGNDILNIAYRSLGPVQVLRGDGQLAITLDAAPSGATAQVAVDEAATMQLRALQGDALIEHVELAE